MRCDPFSLRVRFRHRSQDVPSAVVPDRLFALHSSDGRQFNFALELDPRHHGYRCQRLVGKSSFRRKLLGYFHAWAGQAARERVGLQELSRSHRDDFRRADRQHARTSAMLRRIGPPGLFLYATPKRLAQHGALGPAWVDDEERQRLVTA